MGVNDRAQNKKDAQLKAKQQKKQLGMRPASGSSTADWEGVDGALVCKLAAKLAFHGGAIRLGYTRDGGAYAIGIYGYDEPYTVYLPPSEDIDDWFKRAIEDIDNDDKPTPA